jgi:2-hydroxymethylglutarate dehydrogenase
MKKTIGFIGLGAMGKPMATNLVKKGFQLVVCDVRKEPVNELMKMGANSASLPKEVASLSEVVITMLPSSVDVEEVVLGKNGLIEAIREGSIYIDMSTIAPATTRKVGNVLLGKGVRMIDAPVARMVKAAIEGNLAIFVGGEKEVFEECREILGAMGTDIYHVGGIGCGEVVKIVNNLILLVSDPVIAEGMVLGVKAGVKPDSLFEALSNGSANSFALQTHFKDFVMKGDFREGLFSVDYTIKDLGLALEMGRELHVPLLFSCLAFQLYESAMAAGKSKNFLPIIATMLEELTGVQVRREENWESTTKGGINN